MQVWKIALASRVLCIVCSVIADWLIPDWDASALLIYPALEHPVVQFLIGPFVKWDAVYFLRIAQVGYEHEQVHAFFPGFPVVIRALQLLISPLLDSVSVSAIVDQLAVCGFIIANVSFIVSAVLVHQLSSQVLTKRKAELATWLYCFPACNIFMSSVYTESLFATLCFASILAVKRSYVLATLFGVAAGFVRSTALFLVAFFIAEGLRQKRWFAPVVSSVFVAASSRVYLFWARSLYCTRDDPANWCSEWADIYSYIQFKFWDVGLFRYYQLKNIGFFLLALPTFFTAVTYYIVPWVQRSVKGRRLTIASLTGLAMDKHLPFVAHLVACLLVTLLLANVQIITRMLSASPAFLWAQVEVFESGHWFIKYVLTVVHVAYFFIGPVLFTNFLPWT